MTTNFATDANLIARRDADDRAARLTTQAEAIELYERARKSDLDLQQAIQRRAKQYGWDLTGKTGGNLPQILQDEAVSIVEDHKRASQPLRTDLDNGRITTEYALDRLGTTYTDRITALKERAAQNVTVAQQSVEKTIASSTAAPTGRTDQQLLTEIRTGKAWDRIVRELTNTPTETIPEKLADKIVNGTDDESRAVITEGKSYLASIRNPEGGAYIDHAVQTKYPAIVDARRNLTIAEKLRDVTNHNAAILGHRVATVAPSNGTEQVGQEFLAIIGYVDPTTVKY